MVLHPGKARDLQVEDAQQVLLLRLVVDVDQVRDHIARRVDGRALVLADDGPGGPADVHRAALAGNGLALRDPVHTQCIARRCHSVDVRAEAKRVTVRGASLKGEDELGLVDEPRRVLLASERRTGGEGGAGSAYEGRDEDESDVGIRHSGDGAAKRAPTFGWTLM